MYSDKPDGDWDKTVERMMLNFAESGHPIFRATSALERGEFRSKEKGKRSTTILSVNQLSLFGAVTYLCKEVARDSPSARKPAGNENWESMVVPTEFLMLTLSDRRVCTGKLVARTRAEIRRTS